MSLPINVPIICSIAAIGAITIIGTYAYVFRSQKKRKLPTKWTEVATVTKLFIYPLKSGRRLELDKASALEVGFITVEENGLKLRDRSFIVYGETNNEFKTARTYPNLLKIVCSPHDKDHVVFDAPDQRPLYVEVPKRSTSKPSYISLHHGEKIETLDCGDEAASWISRFLDKPNAFRIGYHDGEFKRDANKIGKPFTVYEDLTSESMGLYSDLSGFHLINESSIEKLNAELEEPITANNYRPNILVKGDVAPFAEEDWDYVKIGDAIFKNVKPCTRCILTTINPESAIRSKNREPLKTLESLNVLKDPVHIAGEGKSPVMGINLGLIKRGVVNVGDTVYISLKEQKKIFN